MRLITLEEHVFDRGLTHAAAPELMRLSPHFREAFDASRGYNHSPTADVLFEDHFVPRNHCGTGRSQTSGVSESQPGDRGHVTKATHQLHTIEGVCAFLTRRLRQVRGSDLKLDTTVRKNRRTSRENRAMRPAVLDSEFENVQQPRGGYTATARPPR
jgi:hypothetical protein